MNFYFSAAEILDRLDNKKGSIKGLISTVAEKDRKRTSALVIQTLKYKPVLVDVIEQAKLLKEERKKLSSLNLALVLVHDVLFSNGIQAGDGPIKQSILRHKTRLHSELQKLKIKRGVKSNEELAQTGDIRAALIPRYVRVNTTLWSIDDAVQYFTSNGFILKDSYDSLQTSKQEFSKDEHIPALLLFHPQVSFQDEEAYRNGKVILQDKASCFPAVVLDPPASPDAVVIDATSAPGNKTSHLSTLMCNLGTLFAFERDRKRFSTLQTMLAKAKCKNVEPVNADFLTVDPSDPKYSQVTHILLDPSCSGSGIVNRLDYLVESEQETESLQEDRLNKLAGFQLMMIKHAMKFPSVKRIVYSTCSIYAIEDEHVVRSALKSDEALSANFELAPPNEVLPQWKRRGYPNEMDDPSHAISMVRCLPGEDATNGFFVSCFVRRTSDGDRVNDHRKRKRMMEDEDEDKEKDDEEVDHGAEPVATEPRKKKKKKIKKKKNVKIYESHRC
ncbi:S-adenosyl-L-methionine-dependent methyltransferase [Rhodocollybia butyracea]|uniref:S-adenosyl-L-methionine-dependent methyltransferase n=1 Tax=Rhodocollybia butyracea TaxID=206335 RepID=A0A9P5PLF1_9AGAR|nr:S-adenosyl-L-methionine-dependent methyltransferase [Rhodocollybia butyracea]